MSTLAEVLANILTIVFQPDKDILIRSRINCYIPYI